MAPIGRLSHIVVDCADPERLARFWTEALGIEVAAHWNQYVILAPTSEGAPALAFQEVSEAKQTKNRVHVDVEVADLDVAA
ncbi:MAG TPA: VOC family protein, partial [Acidimicrobiales bacterium]